MSVYMGRELAEELKKFERPRAPTGCLIGKNVDGSLKTSQWSKQKKSAEKKNAKRQQPKLSLTKHSRSEQHPRGSHLFRQLQPVREDNMPNSLFNVNFCLTSNILVSIFFISRPIQSTHGHEQQRPSCLQPRPVRIFGRPIPRKEGTGQIGPNRIGMFIWKS